MLRFGKKTRRPVRNYATRREQLRLLALFVPLALVVLLMARLRDPKTAAAINALVTDSVQKSSEKSRPVADLASNTTPALVPGLDAAQLKSIKDNTYFRSAEKDAW